MKKDSPRHDSPTEIDIEASPVAMGPDGGPVLPAGFVGQPASVPPRTPENFICLRGPCRHYWHLVTMSGAGNPAELWEQLGIPEPRKHWHLCLVNPGYETSFEDDNAFECNRWDPIEKHELIQIRTRRERYYEEHPEHRPAKMSAAEMFAQLVGPIGGRPSEEEE